MNSKLFAGLILIALMGCGSSTQQSTPPASSSTSTDTGTVVVTPPPAPGSGLTADQKAQIIATIQNLGADAVDLGLTQWSKSNQALATKVAAGLSSNIETTLLPVLNGNSVPPSTAVQALVAANLYTNIPPIVSMGIQGATLIMDHFFSIPAASESDKIDFIRAFVVAIDNGCKQYLATPPAIGKSMRHHTLIEADDAK